MCCAALGHSAPVLILSPHMYSGSSDAVGGSAVMPMTALCRDYLNKGLSVCMYVCIYVLYVCIYTQTYIMHIYIHIQGSLISEGWVGRFGSGNRVRLLARTPPFPIQRVGTWLELLHS